MNRMRHAQIWLAGTAASLILAGTGLGARSETVSSADAAAAGHGLSLYGPQDLKYHDWAAHGGHFDCVNPDAPKGGELKIGFPAGSTKLNPYSLKGLPVYYPSLFVFETLMLSSPDPDEPFSVYGLLAEKAAIAADRLSVTYWLNPKARFSDGRPVTADDVVFTFNLFQDPG